LTFFDSLSLLPARTINIDDIIDRHELTRAIGSVKNRYDHAQLKLKVHPIKAFFVSCSAYIFNLKNSKSLNP
jgi:hypothetical protein